MIPDQRREHLLRLLEENTVLSVHELTERLEVSHMTIRRDIAALQREGRAFSVPGGARIASQMQIEPSFLDKSITELPEKRGMATTAANLIEDNMTVYLDAGTTILNMVPHLLDRSGLTVLTNDFTTTNRLLGAESIRAFHIGGQIEHKNRSTVGRLAAATLRQVNIDLAFISASSWDLHRGVTTPTEAKVEVKQAAMEVSTTSVLVSGSTKFGTFSMHHVAALSQFGRIITDSNLPLASADGIRDLGVTVTRAEPIE